MREYEFEINLENIKLDKKNYDDYLYGKQNTRIAKKQRELKKKRLQNRKDYFKEIAKKEIEKNNRLLKEEVDRLKGGIIEEGKDDDEDTRDTIVI